MEDRLLDSPTFLIFRSYMKEGMLLMICQILFTDHIRIPKATCLLTISVVSGYIPILGEDLGELSKVEILDIFGIEERTFLFIGNRQHGRNKAPNARPSDHIEVVCDPRVLSVDILFHVHEMSLCYSFVIFIKNMKKSDAC